ncbi:hypothetical protein E2C01_097681 [Portunus trituberculatus]|uniref:Uncharacterized protein n=1 Tax=Portunus trituberculatus TaxID=210409 RepID=A0A5B7JVU2_PORTR|nr:hypothetical protein [Portunus trituberculatus]
MTIKKRVSIYCISSNFILLVSFTIFFSFLSFFFILIQLFFTPFSSHSPSTAPASPGHCLTLPAWGLMTPVLGRVSRVEEVAEVRREKTFSSREVERR